MKICESGKMDRNFENFQKFFFSSESASIVAWRKLCLVKKYPLISELSNMFDFWNITDKIYWRHQNLLTWASLESSWWAEQDDRKFSKIGRRNPEKIQNEEILELVIEINRKNRNLRITRGWLRGNGDEVAVYLPPFV